MGEPLPRRLELALVEIETLLDGLDDLGPTGMRHPSLDIVADQTMIAEKAVHRLGKRFARELRHLWAQHDFEAAVDDVPAHHLLGMREEHRAAVENTRLRLL